MLSNPGFQGSLEISISRHYRHSFSHYTQHFAPPHPHRPHRPRIHHIPHIDCWSHRERDRPSGWERGACVTFDQRWHGDRGTRSGPANTSEWRSLSSGGGQLNYRPSQCTHKDRIWRRCRLHISIKRTMPRLMARVFCFVWVGRQAEEVLQHLLFYSPIGRIRQEGRQTNGQDGRRV